jgi:hypothetical protein
MNFKDRRFDSEDEKCVPFDWFRTAVFVWVQMNENKRPTVTDVAAAFSTNEEDVREAIKSMPVSWGDVVISDDNVVSIEYIT